MTRRSVVFPDPDGPRSASRQPLGASTLTLSSARNLPKRFVTFWTVMLMRGRSPAGLYPRAPVSRPEEGGETPPLRPGNVRDGRGGVAPPGFRVRDARDGRGGVSPPGFRECCDVRGRRGGVSPPGFRVRDA